MNKQEFLNRLAELLTCLPAEKVAESQAFYAEAIADRMEDGMTEEEAIAAIGSPNTAAEAILDGMPVVPRAVAKTKRKSRALLWALAVLGAPLWLSLGIGFGAVAVAVYASIWAMAACIWIVAAALLAGLPVGILLAICGGITGNIPYTLVQLGGATLLFGLGLLGLQLAIAASKQLVRLSRVWVRKVASPFKKAQQLEA